ncbi:hypothetical protein [Thiomicrospira aerophila]|nr:hypothetical protein [Thiomicrospira aerophila]
MRLAIRRAGFVLLFGLNLRLVFMLSRSSLDKKSPGAVSGFRPLQLVRGKGGLTAADQRRFHFISEMTAKRPSKTQKMLGFMLG